MMAFVFLFLFDPPVSFVDADSWRAAGYNAVDAEACTHLAAAHLAYLEMFEGLIPNIGSLQTEARKRHRAWDALWGSLDVRYNNSKRHWLSVLRESIGAESYGRCVMPAPIQEYRR